MAKSDKLKKLIEALGGEPPRTDSISDCLDALCGCNIGGGSSKCTWDDLGKGIGKAKVLENITLNPQTNINGETIIYHEPGCVITDYDKLWVVVNGVEHECNAVTVFEGPGGNREAKYFGNYSLQDANQEDTGEPFVVGQQSGNEKLYFVFAEEGEYTISLYAMGETVIPLPEEYMPLLTSPNGTKWKLTVDDSGTVSAIAV